MKISTKIFLIVISLIVPIICFMMWIHFQQNCSGYLKQAADANTPELAIASIDKALEYIEANNLTQGYTSIVYRTEDENIGFWYQNIKACREELEACLNSSQLEKTNVLMKVRESLTDNGKNGVELTVPAGIHKYPHNTALAILYFLSVVLFCIGCFWPKWNY